MKRTIFNRKSQKGNRFTADYIDFDKAVLKGNELLWSDKQMIIGFYIIFSLNTGLRVSDILARKHSDLANKKVGDYLVITEKKTKKSKELQLNKRIIDAYSYLIQHQTHNPDDLIFKSQKGTVYAVESLNTILKQVFSGYVPNISTHSLRKSFGRHVYETYGRSDDALIKLSELFQHSNMSITRRYLGLTREELGNIYLNL